jgi:hypothetical protein
MWNVGLFILMLAALLVLLNADVRAPVTSFKFSSHKFQNSEEDAI